MQPYPNYSQMNNPYAQMNNMYAQPNNPYADRMNFLQNYQQSLQQPIVPTQTPVSNQMSALGKMVDSIDVVKAMDVPLDGSIIYFPKTDGTEIYTKQLQKDGTSKICTFKLKTDTTNEEQKPTQGSDIKKEDIEKITSDIVEVKKSIENNFSNILKKIDSFQNDFHSKSSNKGGK